MKRKKKDNIDHFGTKSFSNLDGNNAPNWIEAHEQELKGQKKVKIRLETILGTGTKLAKAISW